MIQCQLCRGFNSQQLEYSPQFYACNNCKSIFRNPIFFLSSELERERYLLHNTNMEDQGHEFFVTPIIMTVRKSFNSASIGLDYGAGNAPVASKLLSEYGYRMKLWDPFFHKDTSVLKATYDFVICCEVMEHFQNPLKEFRLIKNLLNEGGALFCMTNLLPKMSSFKNWYYKMIKLMLYFIPKKT